MNAHLMVVRGPVKTSVRIRREATHVDAFQFLDTNSLMMDILVKVRNKF